MEIQASKVFQKTNDSIDSRIIVHEGSARSSKTYSIIQYLVILALNNSYTITVSRQKHTWLRDTILPDFEWVLRNQFDMWSTSKYNKVESTYKLGNSTFYFTGLDQPQKLHGRRNDIVWINEAMEASYDDYAQLAMRTSRQIILDYNPCNTVHWIFDRVISRDDCTFIHSTYKDNPFLSEHIINEIERYEPNDKNLEQGTADETLWKIYGLGERAAHQGLIFGYMEVTDELPPQNTWKKDVYGLDFGYTNDPTALVQVVYSQGNLYFEELLYERGLVNRVDKSNLKQLSIEQRLIELGIDKRKLIYADSAEPKSIQDLKNAGYNVVGAAKGPDSVLSGIEVIKRFKCFITSKSRNMITEKNNYTWRKDKNGELLNQPVDAFNHCFEKNTIISVVDGYKKICNVVKGDLVKTRNGAHVVLNSFTSGVKEIFRFKIKTNIGELFLDCTKDHRILTKRGWIEIQWLEKNDLIYLDKNLMEKLTTFTRERNTSLEQVYTCIELSGSFIMAKYLTIKKFIISIETDITMTLKTLVSLIKPNTEKSTQKDLKINLGMQSLEEKDLKVLRNGISQKREGCGINSTIKNIKNLFTKNMRWNVFPVAKSLLDKRAESFAQTIVSQGIEEKWDMITLLEFVNSVEKNSQLTNINQERSAHVNAQVYQVEKTLLKSDLVYDITVDNEHEFYANGILVHNCYDAARYVCISEFKHLIDRPFEASYPEDDLLQHGFKTVEEKIKYYDQRSRREKDTYYE